MKYVKGFDTIRALAVVFVIVEHWGPLFQPHTSAGYIKSAFLLSGAFGVNLFFVLSGFLITSILLHEKEKHIEGKNFTIIKNFFVRRALRIFPIYYLVVLSCYFLNYAFVVSHIWYFLTYTSNVLPYRTNLPNVISHTWSLSVEEQFYLIWPWIIILTNKKYLKYVFFCFIIIGVVSKYMALFVYHHYFAFLAIHCFDAFGIGAFYAYIRLDKEQHAKFVRGFKIVFPLLLFIDWKLAPVGGYPICYMYTKLVNSIIGVAMIMLAIYNQTGWIKKYILENRVFNFIGKISYGIYLYHYTFGPSYDTFIIGFARNHPSLPALITNFYFSYCIKLVLLVIICWLSYVLIEQPILRLKKKFAYP